MPYNVFNNTGGKVGIQGGIIDGDVTMDFTGDGFLVTNTGTATIDNFGSTPAPKVAVITSSSRAICTPTEDPYSQFLTKLGERAKLQIAYNPNSVMPWLNAALRLQAVVIADKEILNDVHAVVDRRLKEYVGNGGIVLYDCRFSQTLLEEYKLKPLFDGWGLGWQIGDYTGTARAAPAPEGQRMRYTSVTSLPSCPLFTGKHLRLDKMEHAVYKVPPYDESRQKNRLASLCPVAMAKFGKGWVGYVGMYTHNEETDKIIFAMLGL